MSSYTSDFLRTLDARGYIKQVTHTNELDAYCAGTPVAYIGFDATAESLHVGSLVGIMMLRRFQQAGGKPIVLMGGGTTKVGDPTDKEKSRPILTEERIAANIAGIRKAFEPFLTFGDGPTDAVMVNNDDWLSQWGYVEFLRDIGKYFTINTMVKQETVARRLREEQPFSFLEFNYLLLQSYDFLELSRRYNCFLQMGGSDQWGNILGGADLIHKADGGQGFGLTCPLITTASGGKMGKTADGAVWLNAEQRSPYEYWQFWRNTEDADVGKFLKLFTELPLDKIARLEALEGADINVAKLALADAATIMLHGKPAADRARAAAILSFKKGVSADLPTFELDTTIETHDITKDNWKYGRSTVALLVAAKIATSNRDARQRIKDGAVFINDEKITELDRIHLYTEVLPDVKAFKVQGSKKRIALVKPV